ncbi:MAG TPA: carbonate dehydratase [Cyanobacteria bacterium UBA11369]|nr:carbonate dehydratase [Cyanobacteria bacterium UBA11371]HBE35874.1 carbonate dehydratase [Cyanobacteria bacterium UBA11368]HBE54015.1 carbonate dehydratase [Cyanobacteria bacterium UBA11369]
MTLTQPAKPLLHPYLELPATEVAQRLDTDLETGLRATEIVARLDLYGFNELAAKPGKPAWLRFLLQFNQALLYILLVAGLIKALLGSWTNAAVIWGVTVINAIIGFVQESKAEGAIAALAKAVSTEATVVREGKKIRIPSGELVPGDLVLLTSGDKIPADLRLVTVRNLQVNESALTGESLPVEKQTQPLSSDTPLAERVNMAYAGSFVTSGQGSGIVVATGNATEVGQISQSIEQQTSLSTPLTRKFAKFSQTLLYVILFLATVTFAVGIGQGQSWTGMFEAAVALAVSAIPEGLPAVVTVTLAIGVDRMARRHAIIRKLPAVEALGSATVICSDKTGTLTENQMTVQAIYVGGQQYSVSGTGYSAEGDFYLDGESLDPYTVPALEECLIAGLLCNDAHLEQKDGQWGVVGDPTEGALIAVARKAGLDGLQLNQAMPRLDTIPFESEFQFMATLHQLDSQAWEVAHSEGVWSSPYVIYLKGSVETVLNRCWQMVDAFGNLMPLDRDLIETEVEKMAKRGLRVLALAKKPLTPKERRQRTSLSHEDVETNLIFIGLQGMIDPPRREAIAAVNACQSAGIQVKMITGDHIATARAIAQRIGLHKDSQVLAFSGQELEQMDSGQLTQAAETGVVFARVSPAQKLRLVTALQSQGEIVAMTGDGVNDAAALKQADIGIAMGKTGTDVAKEAADMLLTDDNFASIEAAVEEGRTVYQNLRKAIAFILPVNGGESMTILISALLARDLPILALQVLWLNMVNSVTMTVPLAFEPKSDGLMQQPPRNPREPLLSGKLFHRILAVSAFNWILIFGMFEWARQAYGDIAVARTMAIQALIAGRVIYLLSISELGAAMVAKLRGRAGAIKGGRAIAIGIVCTIFLQILFSQWGAMNVLFETAPLNLNQWLICLIPALPMIVVAAFINRLDPPNS